MSENTKTALLVGATGLVGRCVLDILLEDPIYSKVTVLSRRPVLVDHPKLNEVIVDFDKLSQYTEAISAEDIFCCLGTTIKKAGSQAAFRLVDQVYPVKLAELALNNGAKQYLIITAMGSDKKSLIFYNRVKGEVEEALEQMPYPAVQVLHPSLLMGERSEARAGEGIAQILFNMINPLMSGPLRNYRAISGEQVARAMVAIAKAGNKGFHIYQNGELLNY